MSQDDPLRPKRLKMKCEEIAKSCDDLQKLYANKAEEAGRSRDWFKELGFCFEGARDYPTFAKTELMLNKYKIFLSKKQAQVLPDIGPHAYSVVSTSMATVAISMPEAWAVTEKNNRNINPPFNFVAESAQIEKCTLCFDRLDPHLCETYRSVWQIFYGTNDAPERNALFAMRQTYDHLFRILAPDDNVRCSPYFSPKKDSEQNKVHRRERYLYAAKSKVRDKDLAELLISQVDNVLEAYKALNMAHSDKPLNREVVKELLRAMQSILEQWADALDIR